MAILIDGCLNCKQNSRVSVFNAPSTTDVLAVRHYHHQHSRFKHGYKSSCRLIASRTFNMSRYSRAETTVSSFADADWDLIERIIDTVPDGATGFSELSAAYDKIMEER
jgi:hypothetical protein